MKKVLILGLMVFMVASSVVVVSAQEPVLRIYGEVNNPINITYSQFQRLPMVHVNSSLICVGSPACLRADTRTLMRNRHENKYVILKRAGPPGY